ncbi:MAG: 3-deoxy-8-phosphooctulonate synthase [Desulfobacterales bacterium]|jgi:2-dehydro-3-deoxyphosphooctonate aldolase (KDO 8-P synthase)
MPPIPDIARLSQNRDAFLLIAGPCVIENPETTFIIADTLKALSLRLNVPLVFKASFDKANRTSIGSFRGPGIEKGLSVLSDIKNRFELPVLSDVHHPEEVDAAGDVLDILQIPAFLCRQTDLLVRAGASGKTVNIKKGQFLSPWDLRHVIEKVTSTGNRNILITERGSIFGYNNLIVDFRGIPVMQETGFPVIFDATHSVQLPGGQGAQSGGQREFAPVLAKAAVAAGVDGLFMEVHPKPDEALCDGPNALPLESIEPLLRQLLAIRRAVIGQGCRDQDR